MKNNLTPYQKVLKYEQDHTKPVKPLPSAHEFIRMCELDLENDDHETLRKLHGLVMESLYLDIYHPENKKQLLRETKAILEQKLARTTS